jgi:hypothetical protein
VEAVQRIREEERLRTKQKNKGEEESGCWGESKGGKKAGTKKKEKRKVEAVQRIREEERLGTKEKNEKRKVEAVQRIREEDRLGTKEKTKEKWRLCRG